MSKLTQPYPEPIPQGMIPPPPSIRAPIPLDTVLQFNNEGYAKSIINEFSRQNWFFANCPRETVTDVVSGGAALRYTYFRQRSLAAATPRAFNADVSETRVDIESVSTEFARLASAISIDHRLAQMGSLVNQVQFQSRAAIDGILASLNEMIIRGRPNIPNETTGDKMHGAGTFYGLDAIIRDIDYNVWKEPLDMTDFDRPSNEIKFQRISDEFMARLADIDPYPQWILSSKEGIYALIAMGKRANLWQQPKDNFGNFNAGSIMGIQLINMGRRAGKNEPVIKSWQSSTKITDEKHPDHKYFKDHNYLETKFYVGSFGDTAVHALDVPNAIDIRMPDLSEPNTFVHKGNFEYVYGLAVKSRFSVGLFDHVYVPTSVATYGPDYYKPLPDNPMYL